MFTQAFKLRLRQYASLYLAWVAVFFVLTGGLHDSLQWYASWMQWDAHWYKQIALEGSVAQAFKALAFPPGYPWLVQSLSILTRADFLLVAMIVGIVTYFVAIVLFVELMCRIFNLTTYAMLFLLCLSSPTGYLVFSAYSEPLFMCMMWGLLFLALVYPHHPHSKMAQCVLLLCLPWVRIVGYAFGAWLLLKRWSALLVMASAALWLAYNDALTGNAFQFVESQHMFFSTGGTMMIDGFWHSVQGLVHFPFDGAHDRWIEYLQMQFLPLMYLGLLTLTSVWFWYQKQPLLAISIGAVLFISHYAPFWRSVVRHDMVILSCVFVPLLYYAERSKNYKIHFGVLLGAMGLGHFILQIAFGILFRHGYWAF